MKQAAISVDINQQVLMEKAKQNGGNLNSLIMSVLSLSLKQYLHEEAHDTKTERIQLAIPLSLREKPKHITDFDVNNDLQVLPFRLRLFDKFDDAFPAVASDLGKITTSLTPFGAAHMHKVIMRFPSFVRFWILNDFSKRFTFSYNFVHGPRSPNKLGQSHSISQAFFGVSICTMSGQISVFCHNGKVKVTIVADKAAMKHPQKLMDIFYGKLTEVCGPKWRST